MAWAAEQILSYSDDKLVLWALAYHADCKSLRAYPSIAAICEFSSLERRRVMNSMARLAGGGWVEDTGERIGRTAQVKVWRLCIERVP